MLLAIVCAVSAHAVDYTALVGELAALPDHEARKAKLTAALTANAAEPGAAARLGNAIGVVAQLEAQNRTDKSIVSMFLKAALDADEGLRKAALEAATAGGDPPVAGMQTAPPPPPAPVSSADPAKINEYKLKHLYREKLHFSVTTGSANQYGGYVSTQNVFTWAVYDGGGTMLTTPQFQDWVGDSDGQQAYKRKRKRRTSWGLGLTAVGTAAFAGGTAMMFSSISDLDTTKLYAGTGVLLASAIPLSIGLVQFPLNAYDKRLVSRIYEPTEADKWVKDYNARLTKDLGLQPADVAHVQP